MLRSCLSSGIATSVSALGSTTVPAPEVPFGPRVAAANLGASSVGLVISGIPETPLPAEPLAIAVTAAPALGTLQETGADQTEYQGAPDHQSGLPPGQILCGPLESLPWEDGSTDAVICSAVLHFARDEREFAAMLEEMWRILAPGGLFFARLATSIGLERHLSSATGRVRLPDGSERYVVDEPTLLSWTSTFGGTLADPLKTTNVQNMRCMTTWVMEK